MSELSATQRQRIEIQGISEPRTIDAGKVTITLDRADAIGVGFSLQALANREQPNTETAPIFARVGKQLTEQLFSQVGGAVATCDRTSKPDPDALNAARSLVEHLLERMEVSKELTSEIGYGSQTRELLVNALIELWPDETRSGIGEDLARIDGKHWPARHRRRA